MRYPSTNITLSPPESLPPYTAPMNATDDFISHGLEQARYALLDVRNLTEMVRAPVTLRRGVAQRAASRLNVLEVIVRRLVLLLALGLRLAPVRPRFPTSTAPLPHGVEDVTHTSPALPAPIASPLPGGPCRYGGMIRSVRFRAVPVIAGRCRRRPCSRAALTA